MHNRRFIFANPKVRSATALLLLVGICASALPIPLGRIVRQIKEISVPFPCQHCACGCKNAEQCWTNCCCYTPAQKAQWAKENKVTPPAYAVLKDDESLADSCETKENGTKSCCSKNSAAPRKSAQSNQIDKRPACPNCARADNACEEESCDGEKQDPEAESVMVLSIMAYKCSGQATVFSLLPWAIIETQPNTARCWELLGRQSPNESLSPIRVFLFPDVPPPRPLG